MALPDLIAGIRSKEELVAVATASSLMTRPQIKLFSQCAAGSNPIALENTMLATIPRGARGGPMLPYLVMGDLNEVGTYIEDAAKLLIAIYSADPELLKAFFAAIPDILAGRGQPISIGAQNFYQAEPPTQKNFLSPYHVHQRLSTVGMATVLAWQGVHEDALGTGYSGTTQIKGTLPATVHPAWQGAAALRTPAPDDATAAAAAAAQGLAERVK